jgi:hypothetical protein
VTDPAFGSEAEAARDPILKWAPSNATTTNLAIKVCMM